MGRPKKNIERTSFAINEDVIREVRAKLTLAYTGKVQYGAMSRLCEALLRKWLRGEIPFDPIIIDDLDKLEIHSVLTPDLQQRAN